MDLCITSLELGDNKTFSVCGLKACEARERSLSSTTSSAEVDLSDAAGAAESSVQMKEDCKMDGKEKASFQIIWIASQAQLTDRSPLLPSPVTAGLLVLFLLDVFKKDS